jgi:hypothetical protein
MRQLFRDLCHDAHSKNGFLGLACLWLRTLLDLAVSLTAAYWEATEEVLMMLDRSVTPVAWGKVALVVVPGLLFGISRVIVDPLTVLAALGFQVVAILAVGVLIVQRRIPIWGLLALGLLTGWALQWLNMLLPEQLTRGLFRINLTATRELGTHLIFSPDIQQLIVAIPVWLVCIGLLWQYRQLWRRATWAVLLLGLTIVGAAILIDLNVLLFAGLVLLTVALGLPLSRQYGSLASLFTLGVFSSLVLLDSDYYSGAILNTQSFYPLYIIPLIWMLVSVAPLFLMRAPTLRGQAIGLLAPALVWGIARIAVPVLLRPDFHPLSVWLGEALLSAFVLLALALSFYLYAQAGNPLTPAKDVAPSNDGEAGQIVYNG